jgi:hypothetical protein
LSASHKRLLATTTVQAEWEVKLAGQQDEIGGVNGITYDKTGSRLYVIGYAATTPKIRNRIYVFDVKH